MMHFHVFLCPTVFFSYFFIIQRQLVGGEKKSNTELKKKHKKRKDYATEREKKMMNDIKKWEGEKIMVKVYDNLQEEIKLKGEDIVKLEKSVVSSKAEIEDLQSEFQAERTDYLDTIRKMERELQLQNQILAKIQPLIRRDCNYSNIDRMKVLAEFDDEHDKWKIPDVQVEKVSLPKTVPGMDSMSSTKLSSTENHNNVTEYSQRDDVDKYAQHILSTQNEQYANQYFKSKRTDKLLSGSTSSSMHLNSNNSNNNNNLALAKLQPLTSPSSSSVQDPLTMQRRPQKLEALPTKLHDKKKKKKNKDQ